MISINDNNIYFEGIISFRAIAESIINGSSDRKIVNVYIDKSKLSKLKKTLSYIKALSYELNYSLNIIEPEDISLIAKGRTHGGLIIECTKRNYPEIKYYNYDNEDVCFYLVGIEDPYNFGYALRSIYASGVKNVLINIREWINSEDIISSVLMFK